MEIFKVLRHVATLAVEPFTGTDIRQIVWQTSDRAEAEQMADVMNLTERRCWVKGYSVTSTLLVLE